MLRQPRFEINLACFPSMIPPISRHPSTVRRHHNRRAGSQTNRSLASERSPFQGTRHPQGKRNSSRNILRHGLLARTVVLEEKSTERFQDLLTALLDEFDPGTMTEHMLIETMAIARWRLLCIWSMQKTALDRDMALQDPALGPPAVRAVLAFNSSQDSGSPDPLLRYEVAFDGQFTRAFARLIALQFKPAAALVPYHPESPSGQTWPESPVSAEDSSPAPLRIRRPSRNEPRKLLKP